MLYCYVISFLLTWGFISTYHKWLNKFFGKPKGDSYWFNWLAHGMGIGIAMIPFAWVGVAWWLIISRAIVLGVSMMLWSDAVDNACWEEFGRGFLIVFSLLIFI